MKKLLSFFILISSFNLLSHEFNPAHLIIDQSDNNQSSYDATWMYPVKNIGKRADVIFSRYMHSNRLRSICAREVYY